jgi:hypothetical protein
MTPLQLAAASVLLLLAITGCSATRTSGAAPQTTAATGSARWDKGGTTVEDRWEASNAHQGDD